MYTVKDNTVWFLQSVPNSCPIPRNTVAHIGGNLGPPAKYLLYKDGQEITIETPNHDYTSEFDPNDEFFWWKVIRMIKQNYGHYLQIIQAQLEDIEFGKTNYAYLLPNIHGPGFYIHHRGMKMLRTLTCPLWAHNILEDEIEFTVWGQAWDRRGIWKGREVDVFYAWDEINFRQLDSAMHAYRAVQRMDEGMDVTFELYGHLLRKDGTVVGLVSQAAKGRLIKESDYSLVYNTVSKLQQHGFLYRGCGTNRFLVSPEGKLRLTEVFSLKVFPRNERLQLAADAEVFHWQELEELFSEIKTCGPFGDYKYPPDRLTADAGGLQLITPSAGPERPLGGIFLYHSTNFFITYHIEYWEGFILNERSANDDSNSTQRRPEDAVNSCSAWDPISMFETCDTPLSVAKLTTLHGRTVSTTRSRDTSYSYGRLRIMSSLSASDVTDNSDVIQLNGYPTISSSWARDINHPYRRLRLARSPAGSNFVAVAYSLNRGSRYLSSRLAVRPINT